MLSLPPNLLQRGGGAASRALSPLQTQVDSLVGGFTEHATDWRSLAAMMAGGMAYRVGRIGTMGFHVGAQYALPLRVASVGLGLTAEVSAFELTHRGITTLSGRGGPMWPPAPESTIGGRPYPFGHRHGGAPTNHFESNLWKWSGPGGLAQGLLQSFITFGTLKGAGRLARGENLVAQHLLQDAAMVLGHQAAGALEVGPRPMGSLAEQFLHAEATNLQIGAGMALANRFAPGMHALERGLDLSLRGMATGSETAPLLPVQPLLAALGHGNVGSGSHPLREAERTDPKREGILLSSIVKGSSGGGSSPIRIDEFGMGPEAAPSVFPYVEGEAGLLFPEKPESSIVVLGDIGGTRTFQLALKGHRVTHIDWDPEYLHGSSEFISLKIQIAEARGEITRPLSITYLNRDWNRTVLEADMVEAFYPMDFGELPRQIGAARDQVLREFLDRALNSKIKAGGTGLVVSEHSDIISDLAQVIEQDLKLELLEEGYHKKRPPIVGGYGTVSSGTMLNSWLIYRRK